MDRDWTRLGRRLAEARETRALKQEDVADTLGVGRSTVQSIEHGKPRAKVTPTIRAYAQLVGWTSDSPELVLGGEEPNSPAPTASAPAPPDEPGPEPEPVTAHDLSLRVIQALKEGPLLDSQVVTVSTPGGQVRATIVVRGEQDRSPEELQRALLEWQKREEAIRRLGNQSDEASGSGA
ncbi:helix-turn-helix transcriptional regulator [Streptomyces cucumeris]|uniref:helix-turn-helix transcriptional regulator n=1 Tax=Streptomyces cucumeris TaxID=2962890 RepID=UPI003D754F96